MRFQIYCPPSSLVSPKREVGAGVGVGMLRGGGIPFIENKQVSKSQSFQVSNFQSFKVPKIQKEFMFLDRYRSHIQVLQEIIKRIFGICRPPPFPTFSKLSMSNILKFPKIRFFKMLRDFLELIEIVWCIRNYK